MLISHVHRFTSIPTPAQFYRCGRAHATPTVRRMLVVAQRLIPPAAKLGPPAIYCPPRWIIVKPQRDNQLVTTQLFDTAGDEPLNRTYMAVVLVEAVVLGALWLFSLYFAG